MRCKVADWGNLGFTAHTHSLPLATRSTDRGRGRGSQRSSLSRHFLRFSRMTRHYSKTLGHLSVRTPSRFVQFWANGSLARLTTLHASFNIWLSSVRPRPSVPPVPKMACCPLPSARSGMSRRPSSVRRSAVQAGRGARRLYSFVGKPSFRRQKSGRFFSVGRRRRKGRKLITLWARLTSYAWLLVRGRPIAFSVMFSSSMV